MYDPRVIENTRTRELFATGDKMRQDRIDKRRRKPLITLSDGNWDFKYRIDPFIINADFSWKMNDTGQATIELPVKGSPALNACVAWLLDPWGRPTAKNIGIRMDKDGARWGGRDAADDQLTRLPRLDDGRLPRRRGGLSVAHRGVVGRAGHRSRADGAS